MGQLDGKVAVITGGASGIGERSARLFVEEGARVVIADMQEDRGREVARSLRGSALFQHAEVSREEDVREAVEAALREFGRLDCIFNNAGFGGASARSPRLPSTSSISRSRFWCGAFSSA